MAKWLEVTTLDGTKELVNFDTCDNVAPNEIRDGSVLWWFGHNADNSIAVEETVSDFKLALGAVGKP